MNHYETLGVEKTASAEEIKRAYRKAASAAHPDRNGGDNSLMQAVNQANDVLGDPERRARYDESGDDGQPDSLEQRAVRQLTRFFDLVLEKEGNLIALVREHMKYGEDAAIDEVRSLRKKVDRLTRRRDKIKVKSGENLVHMLIDGQVGAANQRIASLEEALAVGAITKKLLDEYVSEEQAPGIRPLSDDHLLQMMDAMAQKMQRAGAGRYGSPFGPGRY